MVKPSFVAKFWKEKKDAEPGGASEGLQSGNSKEEIDAASGNPLLGESKEKNGLFILCPKPESEEGLVEYVPLSHSFGFSPDIG
jgi:hypothetical protein